MKVLVTRYCLADLTVEADEIGGCDGELVLFKNEKVVAIFAVGAWVSAVKIDPGSLPS